MHIGILYIIYILCILAGRLLDSAWLAFKGIDSSAGKLRRQRFVILHLDRSKYLIKKRRWHCNGQLFCLHFVSLVEPKSSVAVKDGRFSYPVNSICQGVGLYLIIRFQTKKRQYCWNFGAESPVIFFEGDIIRFLSKNLLHIENESTKNVYSWISKIELDRISFSGSIGRKYILLARNPRVLFNMRDIGFLWKMFVHSMCLCNSGHSVWELSKDFQKKSQIQIQTSSQRIEIDPR